MPQVTGNKSYNSFVKGFISEATPLTFPENASIDEANFVLDKSGKRSRRLGMDYESGYQLVDVTTALSTGDYNDINSLIWEATEAEVPKKILVVQVGTYLYFFDAAAAIVSDTPLNGGTPIDIGGEGSRQMSGTSILGKFVVCNGQKGVIVLEYDSDTDTVTPTARPILVRDIWGVDDSLSVTERPSSLSQTHEYNLVNQGWGKRNHQSGRATYNYHRTLPDAAGTYPSNADIPNQGKDPTSGNDYQAFLLFNQFLGNTPSAKGFSIIDAFRRGVARRNIMTGNSLKVESTDFTGDPFDITKLLEAKSDWHYTDRVNSTFEQLPTDISDKGITTTMSFAGRVWYAGAGFSVDGEDSKSPALGTYLFFSQVVDGDDKMNKCYQENDPTSEIPDPLDSDGGAIKIPDLGAVIKLASTGRSLIIFAENGVWELSGGEDNFSATTFEIRKVSPVRVVSARSIVEAEGNIVFWAEEGIYRLQTGDVSQRAELVNITENSIQTWYLDLPAEAKQRSVGVYDSTSRKIRWLYGEKKNLAVRLTSKPYPYIFSDEININQLENTQIREITTPVDQIDVNQIELIGVLLEQVVGYIDYDDWPPEEIDVNQAELTQVFLELVVGYLEYSYEEELDINQAELTEIDLEVVVGYIDYTNWTPEEIDINQAELTQILLETA